MSRHNVALTPTHVDCNWCLRKGVVVDRHTGLMSPHAPKRRSKQRCPGSGKHYTSTPSHQTGGTA